MSTRSRIGYEDENGKVVSIYCHWDGYPDHNGRILLEHYNSLEKVKELVSLGSISVLDAEVNPPTDKPHSFDHPCNGVVVAYHRDRGEAWDMVKPRVDENISDFTYSDVEEWGYVFSDGKWYVIDGHTSSSKSQRLRTLTRRFIDSHS